MAVSVQTQADKDARLRAMLLHPWLVDLLMRSRRPTICIAAVSGSNGGERRAIAGNSLDDVVCRFEAFCVAYKPLDEVDE